MCACTEPVRTSIGAVCVEYGRPKWPITMLHHSKKQTSLVQNNVLFLFLAPCARTTRYEEAFLPKGKKTASLLFHLPSDNVNRLTLAKNHPSNPHTPVKY